MLGGILTHSINVYACIQVFEGLKMTHIYVLKHATDLVETGERICIM
jgi:hypothetical protein